MNCGAALAEPGSKRLGRIHAREQQLPHVIKGCGTAELLGCVPSSGARVRHRGGSGATSAATSAHPFLPLRVPPARLRAAPGALGSPQGARELRGRCGAAAGRRSRGAEERADAPHCAAGRRSGGAGRPSALCGRPGAVPGWAEPPSSAQGGEAGRDPRVRALGGCGAEGAVPAACGAGRPREPPCSTCTERCGAKSARRDGGVSTCREMWSRALRSGAVVLLRAAGSSGGGKRRCAGP